MELVLEGAFGVPKVQTFPYESKHLIPLPRPTLFVKQRVGLVVKWEDWVRRAIH